jgi:hypothetical protein
MKYVLQIGILFFVFLTVNPMYGQRKPKIKGNRNVISVEKVLSAFTDLVLSENLEITLQPGDAETIKIEADDNLIDVLRFDVEDNTLTISSFYTITASKKLELILVYRQLENIRLETGSLIGIETLSADQLRLSLLEDAKAELSIRSSLLELDMSGKASADLRIEADSLQAALGGTSKSFIYASGDGMDFSMTEQASLELEGLSNSLTLSLTDNAKYKGSGMEAEAAQVFLNASANAQVKALANLAYEGRGKAKLFVYGQPKFEILGLYDSAELRKVPE